MKHALAVLVGSLFIAATYVAWAEERKITEGEKQHCADDYKRLCGEYGLQSNALRDCMDRNGQSLTHDCVEELINAGEVSRSEVERRKRAAD